MHTPETEARNGSLGTVAKDVAEHASALARLELELAQLELKQKIAALGFGAVLAGGAAVVALYAVGWLFATITAALATTLDLWLSLLIVTIVLFLVVGLLGLLARSRFKKGSPPVPTQAIAEARQTTEALKS
jgi:protein-S-isoprenylcysteine O-methyltransferase Ste14